MRAMRGAQREHSGVPRIAPSRDHESVRDKEQVAREAIERMADNHVKPTTALSSCRTYHACENHMLLAVEKDVICVGTIVCTPIRR